MQTIIYILSQAAGIMLPFGFTLGTLVVFVWSVPMVVRFIKSIF